MHPGASTVGANMTDPTQSDLTDRSARVPTAPIARSVTGLSWRLPAWLRYLVAAMLGMGVAGLASYLMRSIGF